MVSVAPEWMRLRMYQVGFGDCFLLTLRYPKAIDGRTERHVLFDCGTSSLPKGHPGLTAIAKLMAADCGGQLDALVVSHRHKDHLGAFGLKAAGKTLAELKPRLVIRPWTEDPKADDDAGSPAGRLLAGLSEGESTARRLVASARAAHAGAGSELVKLAVDEVSNRKAVDALDRLAADGRGVYLHARKTPRRLERMLPGVGVRVLGPPRPADWPAVERQAADSSEYWLGARRRAERHFTTGSINAEPGPMRWITRQLREGDGDALLSLVRWLDDALNNTSLILLLTVGDHRVLLGGDAQIENWSWALYHAERDAALAKELDLVDLYKVGHHGSRNGTPISLHGRWLAAKRDRPFISMMSTKANVHGHGARRVPREPLVEGLRQLGEVITTQDLIKAPYVDVVADLPKGKLVRADWAG